VPDAVSPIAWYRDLSGASKNDALDKNQANQKNLEAGSKQPYPNLADVPDAPDQALSTIDRDKLQKSLVADRANAQYNADRLEAGAPVPGAAPSPPPPPPLGAPPAAAAPRPQPAAAPPRESSLVSPSVHVVPTGEAPPPPPPPPQIPPSPVARTAPATPPVRTAMLDSGRRSGAPSSSVQVAAIGFTDRSSTLSDQAKTQLSAIAAMQHQKGGALRVIGHARPPSSGAAMQQKLDSFTLALARAKAVAQELGAEGVPAAAVAVEAAPGQADDAAAASAQVFLEH
jgi:outer membrane protein OmpA-like peptidoglycan-associated protein